MRQRPERKICPHLSICDHVFQSISYSGPRRKSELAIGPITSGYGTMRCQLCGKREVVEVPDRVSWEQIRYALRPVRDFVTNRPVTRLAWSVVLRQSLGA